MPQDCGQRIDLGLRQIGPRALAENVQQKHWNIGTADERDDAIAAALSFATPGKPDLAGTAASLDFVADHRAGGDHINHSNSLRLGDTGGLGVCQERRRLDHDMH
jgi:hypothetical protein